MLKIKFSEEYSKMLNNRQGEAPRRAILLETFIAETEQLHPRFVEYDTSYFDKKENNRAYYKLPKGKVIVLLLRTEFADEVMMWTTIRRYTPQKFEYYKKNRMEEFEIVINKD